MQTGLIVWGPSPNYRLKRTASLLYCLCSDEISCPPAFFCLLFATLPLKTFTIPSAGYSTTTLALHSALLFFPGLFFFLHFVDTCIFPDTQHWVEFVQEVGKQEERFYRDTVDRDICFQVFSLNLSLFCPLPSP